MRARVLEILKAVWIRFLLKDALFVLPKISDHQVICALEILRISDHRIRFVPYLA